VSGDVNEAVSGVEPPRDVYRLEGRVVLVTGAGAGVGRGMAHALASAGAEVVVTARRPETGEVVAAEIADRGGKALAVPCDVTDPEAIRAALRAAVDRSGRLDHVIHNATSRRSSEVTDLAEATEDLWEEHGSVAVRPLYRLARDAFPHLVESRGSLLVLTSPAGISGSATLPFYATAKAAQRGFLKALAREWGPHGVRVNGLAPLAVTPALENAMREDPTLEPRLARVTPLGYTGDAERDIGPAAVFLCSDAARYVTGQTLAVSGGRFTAL
jgi:NAD(P)-dependent dehydrogenase (short-subunit alcohol dehydrogenase family)